MPLIRAVFNKQYNIPVTGAGVFIKVENVDGKLKDIKNKNGIMHYNPGHTSATRSLRLLTYKLNLNCCCSYYYVKVNRLARRFVFGGLQ